MKNGIEERKRFIENLRKEMASYPFYVGSEMTVDGIGLEVTHIPISDEKVIDDLRDIAMHIVGEFVDEGLCPNCTDTDDDTEFQYQDIILTHLIHNLADMDSPVIKEYIGEG